MGELMDPDETLRWAREAAADAQAMTASGRKNAAGVRADRMATALSYYADLDEWMSKGGIRPQEWTPWGTMWPE